MKLLLLPGLDGTGTLFDNFIDCLPKDLPAVAIAYPLSLETFDDCARFVNQRIADTDESVVLVAESFSGPMAVEILRKPHANLKGVVLVATFVQAPSPRMLALARRTPSWLIRACAGLAVDWFCLNGNNDEIAALRIKDIVQSLPPGLIKARLKIIQSLPADLPKVLAAATLPLMFIEPRRDRLLAKKYFAQIEQLVSKGSVAAIDGPHFLIQSRPRQCADAIADFIRRRV